MSRTALQRVQWLVQWHPLDGCPVALWHLSGAQRHSSDLSSLMLRRTSDRALHRGPPPGRLDRKALVHELVELSHDRLQVARRCAADDDPSSVFCSDTLTQP
jgi:hypothetical protein